MGDAGADRPQDHRRHLRRHGPPRRRRVLGQGPVEGGPLRGVRDALGRQERRRRRPGQRAARPRSPTRSARPSPSASSSRPSAPAPSPTSRSSGAVLEVFDLRPAAIIRDLDLLRPIYAQTAAYGHFGRELPDFTWERTDRAAALRPPSAPEAAASPVGRCTGTVIGLATVRPARRLSPDAASAVAGRTAPMTDPEHPSCCPGWCARRSGRPRRSARATRARKAAEQAIAEVDPVARVLVDVAAGPPRPRLRLRGPGGDGRRPRPGRAGQGALRRPGRRRLRRSARAAASRPPGPAGPAAARGEPRAGAAPRGRRRSPPSSPSGTPAPAPTCCASPCRPGTPPPRRSRRPRARRGRRGDAAAAEAAWAGHEPGRGVPAPPRRRRHPARRVVGRARRPTGRCCSRTRPPRRTPSGRGALLCVPDGKDAPASTPPWRAVLGEGHHVR